MHNTHQKGIHMDQTLNFPAVTGLTPFDRQDGVHSTATFDRGLTPTEQTALKKAIKSFHDVSTGNPRCAIFFAEFPSPERMSFRTTTSREMPTRQLFEGLINNLVQSLKLNLQVDVEFVSRTTHPDSPPSTIPTRFIHRHAGFHPGARHR